MVPSKGVRTRSGSDSEQPPAKTHRRNVQIVLHNDDGFKTQDVKHLRQGPLVVPVKRPASRGRQEAGAVAAGWLPDGPGDLVVAGEILKARLHIGLGQVRLLGQGMRTPA